MKHIKITMLACGLIFSVSTQAQTVHPGDVVIQGSTCSGFDCVNGESFGFDTLRLKENNLRVHFDDTSASASFPGNDWRIIINDSANGGANYFAVEDATAATVPFRIEAGAPNSSLWVSDNGNVGIGTGIPVVEVHVVDGDTPTLRLEQDNSNGWTPQTWDLGSNETNFFIRDATNGSSLPFRIRPGAPTNAIFIGASGNVGFGTQTPNEAIDIFRENSGARLLLTSVTGTNSEGPQMIWRRAGAAATAVQANENIGAFSFRGHNGTAFTGSKAFINVVATENWTPSANGTSIIFQVTPQGSSALTEVFRVNAGELRVNGSVIVNGTELNVPDYVFEDDYQLMSLDQLSEYIEENKHLPGVASAKEVNTKGLDLAGSQLSVLEKVEELTLYTLQQHEELKQVAILKSAHRQLLTAFHIQQEQLLAQQKNNERLEQMVNQLMRTQEGKSVYTSLK